MRVAAATFVGATAVLALHSAARAVATSPEDVRENFVRHARVGVSLEAPQDVRALALTRRNGRADLVPCTVTTGSLIRLEGREAGHGPLVVVEMAHTDETGIKPGDCGSGTRAFLEPDLSTLTPLASWNSPEKIAAQQAAESMRHAAEMEARSSEIDSVVGRIEAAMPHAAPTVDAPL